MKKAFLIIVIFIFLIALSGCCASHGAAVSTKRAIITYGSNGVKLVNMKDYTLYSTGWIRVRDEDGTVYLTNTKNVLIIEEEGDQ